MAYELHPLAKRYPRMTGRDFELLVEDIRRHGVRDPIVLLDGKILDGANRYEAAKVAGKGFRVRQYDPARDGKDPAAFVRSRNDRRRHYTPEQRRKFLEAGIKAHPERSDRQHAAAAHADHVTAGRVRRQLESTGEITRRKKTVGADGIPRTPIRRKRAAKGKPGPKPKTSDDGVLDQVEDVIWQFLDNPAIWQFLKGDAVQPVMEEFVDRLCELLPNLDAWIASAERYEPRGRGAP